MPSPSLPDQSHFGDGDQLIIPQFRDVVRRQVEVFRAEHEHVHKLLGGRHHLSSGTYREGLLREFLTRVLPKSVSVDSGFIYGFGTVEASRQLDVIIWDSLHYAPVFRTGEFVIVAPEAVIAVISVKTSLESSELKSAYENLLSVTPLDVTFRGNDGRKSKLPAIVKIVAAFESNTSAETLVRTTSEFFQQRLETDADLAKHLLHPLQDIDPREFADAPNVEIDRVFPAAVVTLASEEISLSRGYGYPTTLPRVMHGFKWLPYVYALRSNVTSPLEKMVYRLLAAVMEHTGKEGGSLLSAWGDYHPVFHWRIGDAEETNEATGLPLIDPARYKGLEPLPMVAPKNE
jgi:hypothetical protein